jgi:Zn-dependent oligopeptidase
VSCRSRVGQTRDTLSRKLGFASYAHRFTADKMAGSPETVQAFLSDLGGRIRVRGGPDLGVVASAHDALSGVFEV